MSTKVIFLGCFQQRPNPADECKHEEGICEERQRRGGWQYLLAQKILAAVIAKRIEAVTPARRAQTANSLGTPVSRSAADHNAVPAPNEGTLPARVVAVPESMTPSPRCRCRISCIRNSFPLLKNFTASRGRGHHQTHTVYAPRSRLKVSLRDDGPNHAKHSAQSESARLEQGCNSFRFEFDTIACLVLHTD